MPKLRTDRDKTAHLLRRFGLGASESEIDYYLQGGTYANAVDRLLDYNSVDEGFEFDLQKRVDDKGVLRPPVLVAWWVARLVQTRRPLQEKMTLFWHNHFATSVEKVKVSVAMLNQNETLRKNAIGSFRTMLQEVAKDPAMIFWLDNEYNVKGKPNENFAREVMELFTLGIGHYTEADIQQAARAFTGWGLGRSKAGDGILGLAGPTFQFRERAHDYDEKTVFGRTGKFEGEDVLNMLLDNPQTARFLSKKLLNWFVVHDPSDADAEPFAQVLYRSNYDIRAWLRSVMLSDLFLSDRSYRAIYKTPVDFLVSTCRALGYGELIKPELAQATRFALLGAIGNTSKSMGMSLFYPPDVSGWTLGPSWISTATMIERIGWGDRLFGKGMRQKFQAFGIFEQNPTPEGVVVKLLSIFDVSLPQDKIDLLVETARKQGNMTPKNANEVAASLTRLIFATPEFQMA